MRLNLVRLTALRGAMFDHQTPVWVNPELIRFVEPRYSRRTTDYVIVGTRIHFGPDTTDEVLNGILELVEEPDEVLALLAGHDYDREQKLDLTYEAAAADIG